MGRTIKNGCGTALCGDGKAIDSALCDRFRIRFRADVRRREFGSFFVGFVHSDADAIHLDGALGLSANIEHSVGILVKGCGFWLFKENGGEKLASRLPSDFEFSVSAQRWLVEYDFVTHSLCLYLRMPKQWTLAIK